MLSFEEEQALALRKAINEIDFPEENEKTLMDRFREVSNDESLNQLHEEWKKFWKKRSLELHPDKNGSDEKYKERFQAFQNNKEIIDQFFDNFTKSSEADSSKRKFIDDSHKASFSSIINFLSNNQSQNPNQGQSQSSFQSERNQASRAQARHSEESNRPRDFRNYSSTSKSNFDFKSTKEDPRNQSQTTSQGGKQQQNSRDRGDSPFGTQTGNYFSSRNKGSSRDDLTNIDEILRAFIKQKSKQNSSSSKFSPQNGSNFKQSSTQTHSSKNNYSQTQKERDHSNGNYGSTSHKDEKYHSQNHDNSSRSESNTFYDSTFVFCFTAQGVGRIFVAQQNQRTNVKENHNGPSTFANRFGGVNDVSDRKGSSRY
jgi:hypothetical protein